MQFSGDINVQGALHGVGATTMPCDDTQSGFCKGQMDFFTGAGKSNTEAKEAVLKQYADNCRSCLMTKTDLARLPKKQFSVKAGMWRGKQLLSLGGGGTMWNVESLAGLTKGSKDIADIKEAGFAGICFDVEETEGEQELIDAFESTFAMLKKEGLEVKPNARCPPYIAQCPPYPMPKPRCPPLLNVQCPTYPLPNTNARCPMPNAQCPLLTTGHGHDLALGPVRGH